MFDPAKLAHALRQLRKKHRLSLNRLAKLSGISRRTLARLEDGRCSSRTAMKLAKLLIPPDHLQSFLDRQTSLSRAYARDFGAGPDAFALLDLLPDAYPAFLFHHAPEPFAREWRELYAADYAGSFFQLVLRPPRNLGARLRAWRLQHDLSLVETADLLQLSKSQLHRLERNERHPTARTSFRILRLLTLPVPSLSPSGGDRSRPGGQTSAPRMAGSLSFMGGNRPRPGGQAPASPLGGNVAAIGVGTQKRSRHHPKGKAASPPGREGTRQRRRHQLDLVKLLLALPPPAPPHFNDDPDASEHLRFLWLTHDGSTGDLAAQLEISQPHLIRLIRGDRRPSRKLRERIRALGWPPAEGFN